MAGIRRKSIEPLHPKLIQEQVDVVVGSPLTVELFHQLGFFILSCESISNCRFKRIDVYIL